MKNIHIHDILSESGDKLVDLILPMEDEYSWMDVFEKVQEAYLDNVDSYSYTEMQTIDTGLWQNDIKEAIDKRQSSMADTRILGHQLNRQSIGLLIRWLKVQVLHDPLTNYRVQSIIDKDLLKIIIMLYNENVLKWCGPYDLEEYEEIVVDDERDIIIYDDSDEWYNNTKEQMNRRLTFELRWMPIQLNGRATDL